MNAQLSTGAQDLFDALWDDAPSWSGTPLCELETPAEKGYLTNLKRRGLVQTFVSDGNNFASFTEAGAALGAERDAARKPATKHCPLCDQTLPVSAFSRRASAKDGLNPLCRTCRGLRRHDRRVAKAAAKAAEEAK